MRINKEKRMKAERWGVKWSKEREKETRYKRIAEGCLHLPSPYKIGNSNDQL